MSGSEITIIMYHYVRDFEHSRYPAIKGLDVSRFKKQLEHVLAEHTVVTVEDVVAAYEHGKVLPRKSALLTFDDGYMDHYDYVFPILFNKGLQGAFFPPVDSTVGRKLLDVNKIHLILASVEKPESLVEEIFHQLDLNREEWGLASNEDLYHQWAMPGRYDPPEIIFVKRMLQVALPLELRERIADQLFRRFVGCDESVAARELYMDENQLRTMLKAGMHVGIHGVSHCWLGSLSAQEAESEIGRSVEFLRSIGAPEETRSICYPYGSYNEGVVEAAVRHGCRLGFTIVGAVASSDTDDPMLLPRVPTNEIGE